ncbi:hypothetical protein [Flectobacillus roseus]|uniref:hypothetical protein n=1 Tax=Flectobacillus roseus TaxID=502259 RepID=UPI0024B7F120|nr:hypothetical protein [Flectobacillus roseus]MDI9870608.1 hypothetical protein [Flectobacillus roseus]
MENQLNLGDYVQIRTTPQFTAQIVAFLPDNNVSCLVRNNQTYFSIIVDISLLEQKKKSSFFLPLMVIE